MKVAVWFFIFTLLVDQFSKAVADSVLINTGISFGLFSTQALTVILFFIVVLIGCLFGKSFFQISPASAGVFFGASFSNLIDRLFFGGVRDFLPLPYTTIRNNLADWGIILSLLWIFWNLKKTSSTKTTPY